MQCRQIISYSKKRCKLHTTDSSGYCRHHKPAEPVHLDEKPQECPVCYESMHQCTRPLSCGHWVHRNCVRKSQLAECPICREPQDIPVQERFEAETLTIQDIIDDLEDDSDTEVFEIPEENIVMAVLLFQLYTRFIRPRRNCDLGLSDFISGVIGRVMPMTHPHHRSMAAFLYGEALLLISRFFR